MKRFLRPIAALVTALFVAGAAGLAYNTTFAGDDTYKVTAFFEKAISLFPNSDVTILGVAVGKVTDAEPEGDTVRVEMEIDEDFKIPADAFAQIIPISVISDRFVQFEPAYEGGPALRDGAVLDADRTQIPVELDDVFAELKKLLEAFEPGEEGDPGALGQLIVELNRALDDREQDLQTTIATGADLTRTLALAKDDISGLLVNLDDLFGRLATRAGSIGELNKNFALVMAALAQSRQDLEGTLANLADMTAEVGSLVKRNSTNIARDVRIAGKITSSVLRHRASVEESLRWLPTVARGLEAAHHGGEIKATDVRDNIISARCNEFDQFPPEVQDALKEFIDELCGTGEDGEAAGRAPVVAPEPADAPELSCDSGVRKVKRQIRRILQIDDLPEDVKKDIIKPLKKKLRRLSNECEELGKIVSDPDKLLEKILEQIGGLPDVDDNLDDLDQQLDDLRSPLSGSAAGGSAVPDESVGFFERIGSWFSGALDFVGWP